MLSRRERVAGRRGVTLDEAVVSVAILAVFATAVIIRAARSQRPDGDALERYQPTGTTLTNRAPNTSVTGAGLLAIVIPNVALADAQNLARQMEGDQPGPLGSGSSAVVRFTTSGTAPVTVRYFMVI